MKQAVVRTLLLCGLTLLPLALWPRAAAAHEERINGVVLSMLPQQRQAVVRVSAFRGKPSVTVLFALSPRVDAASMHVGDSIDGLVDADSKKNVLDEVQVLPSAPAPNFVHVVKPLLVGDHMPATRFVDQRGRPFDFGDFHGKLVVLSFIYTRCRDADECPMISSHYSVLQRKLTGGPYHLVEMTLDPSFDTPAVLAKYGATFGADPSRWTLATGTPETVLDFDRRFGLDPFADPKAGLIHTARTVFIDREGKLVDSIDQANWNPADIVARLQAMDAKPANIFAQLDFQLSKAAVAICGNSVAGFSGLQDLVIVLLIVVGGAFLLRRIARRIFSTE
ncbi:MAG: SCO family protein [Candidatus Eremiobacteraeota bacterium]|nr:SCO family protein [Candidatus Eremiobacteraeota bacterium]